jgi:hypothetical protein
MELKRLHAALNPTILSDLIRNNVGFQGSDRINQISFPSCPSIQPTNNGLIKIVAQIEVDNLSPIKVDDHSPTRGVFTFLVFRR